MSLVQNNNSVDQYCIEISWWTTAKVFLHAPWLSWLQRPTVTHHTSEGREFEPHWGSHFEYDLRKVLFFVSVVSLYVIY